MDIYQKALEKAKKEGTIDPRILAPESNKTNAPLSFSSANVDSFYNSLPPQLAQLPFEMLDDYRRIIENIRLLPEKEPAKIIGMFSAVPKQGTSTMALILSLLMAEAEKPDLDNFSGGINKSDSPASLNEGKVLLIDSHIRQPSIHKKIELPGENGLYDVFTKKDVSFEVVKKVNHTRLHVVTFDANKPLQLSQVHLERYNIFLKKMRLRYKYILIDIPPLLKFVESAAFSKLCDSVIMVVQAGNSRREVIKEAIKYLKRSEIKLIGAVLNKREFYIPEKVYKYI